MSASQKQSEFFKPKISFTHKKIRVKEGENKKGDFLQTKHYMKNFIVFPKHSEKIHSVCQTLWKNPECLYRV